MLINPGDAAARGIVEQSIVLVENERGRLRAVAALTTDVMPGVVVVPMGYWLEQGQLGTVNGLTPERYADYGRAPTFSDTLVEVSAVEASAEH